MNIMGGYWFSMYHANKKYPIPIISNKKINNEFLNKLKNYVDGINGTYYLGYSKCRICGKNVGNLEYIIGNDDMKIYFPEGIIHYYETHNVEPSKEFYEMIMSS